MRRFISGDLVQLKCGGPKMSVEYDNENGYSCVWFEGSKLMREFFQGDVLVIYKDPKNETSED